MERQLTDYTIEDIALAYIAGFFDGEGCITIQDRRHYNFMIRACNNIEAPIRFIQRILGGNVFEKQPSKTRKRSYIWQCSGLAAAEALEKLLPYLICKKELAYLGIELAFSLPEYREDIANKIYEINRLHGKGKKVS